LVPSAKTVAMDNMASKALKASLDRLETAAKADLWARRDKMVPMEKLAKMATTDFKALMVLKDKMVSKARKVKLVPKALSDFKVFQVFPVSRESRALKVLKARLATMAKMEMKAPRATLDPMVHKDLSVKMDLLAFQAPQER